MTAGDQHASAYQYVEHPAVLLSAGICLIWYIAVIVVSIIGGVQMRVFPNDRCTQPNV